MIRLQIVTGFLMLSALALPALCEKYTSYRGYSMDCPAGWNKWTDAQKATIKESLRSSGMADQVDVVLFKTDSPENRERVLVAIQNGTVPVKENVSPEIVAAFQRKMAAYGTVKKCTSEILHLGSRVYCSLTADVETPEDGLMRERDMFTSVGDQTYAIAFVGRVSCWAQVEPAFSSIASSFQIVDRPSGETLVPETGIAHLASQLAGPGLLVLAGLVIWRHQRRKKVNQ